jgi:hypothetical protein
MTYRCINAFAFGDGVYGNGYQAEDDDPILRTHADHFAKVEEPHLARAVEQAVATPGGLRSTSTAKKAPAKKAAPHVTPKSAQTEEN